MTGKQKVSEADERQLQAFTKAVLNDVHALEHMLNAGMFETSVRRIGAEQEMFLIDPAMRPANTAVEILKTVQQPFLTTELALFNLEINLAPRVFRAACLRDMETELLHSLHQVRQGARKHNTDILLVGTLPTLQKDDLSIENMTPRPRYYEINRALKKLRGGEFHVLIKGLDELELSHDNIMLEACNTSFQIHFQVYPHEFARLYNLAQAITAPVLAVGVNSPVLLKHRLWHETRIALFQRSLETRSSAEQARGQRPRVHFGDGWVRETALEIFREDIARFRIMIAGELDEDPMTVIARGEVPKLSALRMHCGTIYRWNRVCYGISDGKPHLRIENRVLPAGPSIRDEIANAAFFFGLMAAYVDQHPRIDQEMSFDDAKANFFAAAQHGLQAQFTWLGDKTVSASELILQTLLPQAREGLQNAKIDQGDIDEYLGTIEARVRMMRTGARWILHSLTALKEQGARESRFRMLTAAMLHRQQSGVPIHEWTLAQADETAIQACHEKVSTVGHIMSTDLFTVRPGDIIDLADKFMKWEAIHHVLVEDDEGRLVGILSSKDVLKVRDDKEEREVLVSSLMQSNLVTVSPKTPLEDAFSLMKTHQINSLPVVDDGQLVGIVTMQDLLPMLRNGAEPIV